MNPVLDPKTRVLKLEHLACHNSQRWSKNKRNNRLIIVTDQKSKRKNLLNTRYWK